jgi:hypothetical protein
VTALVAIDRRPPLTTLLLRSVSRHVTPSSLRRQDSGVVVAALCPRVCGTLVLLVLAVERGGTTRGLSSRGTLTDAGDTTSTTGRSSLLCWYTPPPP